MLKRQNKGAEIQERLGFYQSILCSSTVFYTGQYSKYIHGLNTEFLISISLNSVKQETFVADMLAEDINQNSGQP